MHSKDIIGLPIVHIDLGKHCGVVHGIVLSAAPQRVAGFVVALPGWRKRGLLPMEHVHAIGGQAVTIQDDGAVQIGDTESDLYTWWRQRLDLHGMAVLTARGQGVGRVQSFRFTIEGTITAIAVQMGERGRWQRDIVTVPGDAVRALGEDAVIVHGSWSPPAPEKPDPASVPPNGEQHADDTESRSAFPPFRWPWRSKSPENEDDSPIDAKETGEIKEDIKDDPSSGTGTDAPADDGSSTRDTISQ